MSYKNGQETEYVVPAQYTWYGRRILTEWGLAHPPDQTRQESYQASVTIGRLTKTGQLIPQPNNPLFRHVKRSVWANSLNDAFIKLAEWKDIIKVEQIYTFDFNTLVPIPHLMEVD